MKNNRCILIGCSIGYPPEASLLWVRSARDSGYDQDLVLLVDIDASLFSEHSRLGCIVIMINKAEFRSSLPPYKFKSFIRIAPHVLRFYFLKEYLKLNNKYEFIITTDVRDVIFQKNPFERLIEFKNNNLIFSGEGILFKHEKWGYKNINQCFGRNEAQSLYDREISNVGILAGRLNYITNLITQIYSLSIFRPIPIVDQAIFNFIISNPIYSKGTSFCSLNDDWAVNLGTYLDPRIEDLYKPFRLYKPPYLQDGKYYNSNGKLFYIVHQYDRC